MFTQLGRLGMAGISALHMAALSLPSGTDLISLLRTTETLGEGLRRLYNATVEHQCFPGDLLETGEDEVSTTDILEALGLSVPSQEKTAGPSLPDSSVSSRSSFSYLRQDSHCATVQQPTPESIGSEPQNRHRVPSNPSNTMESTRDSSDLSAPDSQLQLPSSPFESTRSLASTATCQSQATGPTKDISRSASPMVAGDMCTQFFAAVGHSRRMSMPQPSLLADSMQSQARTSENAFFDFDRYNQTKMGSMMQLQQETQGYTLSSPANILSIPADQSTGPIPDNQMHINPASSSNPLTINPDPSDCFEDGTPANLFGFPPPSTTPQSLYQSPAFAIYLKTT